jgi:cytochrome c peroxidase
LPAFFCFADLSNLLKTINPHHYTLRHPANFSGRYTIPADNPTTKGRRLSGQTSVLRKGNYLPEIPFPCESCHLQKLAFTDGKALSQGADGSLTTRSAMSLANLLWVRNFFWDGRSPNLEQQAAFPLTNVHEMGQPLAESVAKLRQTALYPPLFKAAFGSDIITGDHILKAVAQFERTLISSDSKYDRYLAGTYLPTAQEIRGMILFQTAPNPQKLIRGANCEHCHGGVKTFKELFHNNGLDSTFADKGRENFTNQAEDKGRFRVPTLRNIMLTAPYMHDGRFQRIETGFGSLQRNIYWKVPPSAVF